jgi:DNA polymerase-3 subunit gamma/tau
LNITNKRGFMSLDTKYRPSKYSDVLGQQETKKSLKGFINSGSGWRQSYLFAGPYGSGKTTLGRILARALLCTSPTDGEPCDKCGSCLAMLKGSHDSFVEVDAATNSGKADVKKLLDELSYSSFSGSKKLYLFDESHQLSKDALDALLKPMEENDRGTFDKKLVCIFATTEPEKMKKTVLSRCAPAFIIKPVDSEEIADRLQMVCETEGFRFEREALVLIADFTEGHIRDALKAIEGVASSNSGLVGVEGVRAYLHVDRNDIVCKILLADNQEALSLVEDMLQSTPVGIAYDRLMEASMLAIGLGMGASTPPPYWNRKMLEEAWGKHGMQLLSLADSLASRPHRPTQAMFKCELLKWKVGGLVNLVPAHIAPSPQQIPVSSGVLPPAPQQEKSISVSAFASMVKRYLET